MVEAIFTIDYEIYGNGEGSLRDLVYEPARELLDLLGKHGAQMVFFVEAAELEMLERAGADSAIGLVKNQVRAAYDAGHEIALHLHPQWYNGRWDGGQWFLDYSEYNLCVLPRERITEIVSRSINYLREMVGDSTFTPLSFRAGNWLFQPTREAANVLLENGVRLDSSVFKGGVQHQHRLDYRPSCDNGPYWTFKDDVNRADPKGPMLEVPIYTEMVPFWMMLTGKRVQLHGKGARSARKSSQRIQRLRDLMRLRHPLKFDFCRMTLDELIGMTERVIACDRKKPSSYLPMVAIGHTKDLEDFDTVDAFLKYLADAGIRTSTLQSAYQKCQGKLVAGIA